MPTKHIFLDLEETIISSWDDRLLVNLQRVRDFLKAEQASVVHIFSFAIHNEKDIKDFEDNLKPWLEDVLGVKIASFPSVERVKQVVAKFSGVQWETFEFLSVWGKARAFEEFCAAMFTNCECVLLDDMVLNTTKTFHDFGLTLRTVRV